MDRFGAFAGSLCAIHCAACALLPSLFAALGVGFLLGSGVEWGLTLMAVTVAGSALVFGWSKHRSPKVAVLLGLGILGLLTSRVMEEAGGDHHGEEHAAVESHGEHGDEHGGEHGGEHGDEHGGEHNDEHGGEHGDEHGDEHGHHGAGHGFAAVIGVISGLLLVPGHLLNLRETRLCTDDCADDCD